MRRGTVMLVALVAVLLLGTGMAEARKVSSTITHDGSVALSGGRFLDSGVVRSRHPVCRSLRNVRLIGQLADGTTANLDGELSSIFGAWATAADYSRFRRVKAKATKVTYRIHSSRRIVCKPAVVIWRVPRQ